MFAHQEKRFGEHMVSKRFLAIRVGFEPTIMGIARQP
jgi:hypothetical protein